MFQEIPGNIAAPKSPCNSQFHPPKSKIKEWNILLLMIECRSFQETSAWAYFCWKILQYIHRPNLFGSFYCFYLNSHKCLDSLHILTSQGKKLYTESACVFICLYGEKHLICAVITIILSCLPITKEECTTLFD